MIAPHLALLEPVRALAAAGGRPVPEFDPLDGGVGARLLIVLETPGPRGPEPRRVSRDNPTGTARNLTRFLADAGIARADTIIWNAVPWIVHARGARNRPLRRAEIGEGLTMLPALLDRLPRLGVVILAGRVAAQAEPLLASARAGLPVLTMPHPSPTIVCTSPQIGDRIRATLAAAAGLLDQGR